MENTENNKQIHAHNRSSLWPSVERSHLALNPGCAVCGATESVVVHHILPVPYCLAVGRPELELDPRNLITLCQSRTGILCDDHHLYIGHLGDYHAFNLDVREDAEGRFKGSRKARLWFSVERIHSLQESLLAFPHLVAMTEAQLASLRRVVDERLPRAGDN